MLHVWASDATTANCECSGCTESLPPSNGYLRMLNELDQELTRRQIPTRIGFLVYHGGQLRHPPTQARINNPDRFVMMLAPGRGDYSLTYGEVSAADALPEFVLNQRQTWTTAHYLKAFRGWQDAFTGPAFTFEYHFTWFDYADPGHIGLARLISADVAELPRLGIDGYLGCETISGSFPTSLPLAAKALRLFDPDADLDAYIAEHLAGAYGDHWAEVRDYLEQLSEIFLVAQRARGAVRGANRQSGPPNSEDQEHAERLRTVPILAETFRPTIERQLSSPDPAHRRSWSLLLLHVDYVRILALMMAAAQMHDAVAADRYWMQLLDYVALYEDELVGALDTWYLQATFEGMFGLRRIALERP